MALVAEKRRSQKDQDALLALLDSLEIKDRESPIKQVKQKTLGVKAKKSKRSKGRR